MDINKDGRLSKEELQRGLKRQGILNYEEEADNILKNVDFDQNGTLEFSEYCTAAMSNKKLAGEQNLQTAFNMFD